MQLSGNTILITGGGTGIGRAFAKRFSERDNQVILCGRRAEKLAEARGTMPDVHTMVCDVGNAAAREKLVEHVLDEFPDLNVLVNNAGIQRKNDLTQPEPWAVTAAEIAINLEAPIHFTRLFYPHLSGKNDAAILNVTSGLSFVPLANVPVYCATKAALHSFTLSTRWQYSESGIEVIEVIPPAVDTDLQAPGLHTFGVNVDEFADHVFNELEQGRSEIAYGTAQMSSTASREQLSGIFAMLNGTGTAASRPRVVKRCRSRNPRSCGRDARGPGSTPPRHHIEHYCHIVQYAPHKNEDVKDGVIVPDPMPAKEDHSE